MVSDYYHTSRRFDTTVDQPDYHDPGFWPIQFDDGRDIGTGQSDAENIEAIKQNLRAALHHLENGSVAGVAAHSGMSKGHEWLSQASDGSRTAISLADSTITATIDLEFTLAAPHRPIPETPRVVPRTRRPNRRRETSAPSPSHPHPDRKWQWVAYKDGWDVPDDVVLQDDAPPMYCSDGEGVDTLDEMYQFRKWEVDDFLFDHIDELEARRERKMAELIANSDRE